MVKSSEEQDALYEQAAATHGAAIQRLARGYEPEPDKRRDLIQDIHVALWRSFAHFDGHASLRTWVYRVAHNTAISLVVRRRAGMPALVSLDDLAAAPATANTSEDVDRRLALDRVLQLIQTLKPLDRQVILLYLEDLDAQSIADTVGLSPANVATKVHRIKQILARRFQGVHP
jgi:RNA polymerase sigma-70 factor, ECF subfamily